MTYLHPESYGKQGGIEECTNKLAIKNGGILIEDFLW